MKCAPFPLLAFVGIAQTFGKEPAPTVTFVSPCECIAFHGVNRWQNFPFTVKTVHDLTIAEHVVTVTGKAFYDIAHASADHSNRRHSPKDYAGCEIHPVMKLEVVQ